MISFEQKTAYDLTHEVAARVRGRRKERKLTQAQMAKKAGMSFASYKRFEQTGEIAFRSLCNIAIALGCEQNFDELFAHRQYTSIQEVIDAQREARKQYAPAHLKQTAQYEPAVSPKAGPPSPQAMGARWRRPQAVHRPDGTHSHQWMCPQPAQFCPQCVQNSFDNYSPRPKAEPRRSRGRALRA